MDEPQDWREKGYMGRQMHMRIFNRLWSFILENGQGMGGRGEANSVDRHVQIHYLGKSLDF